MLLPTKGISSQRALLTVGALIIEELNAPTTVSGLWERLHAKWLSEQTGERITFDWFALAASSLFAVGVVEMTENGHVRLANVSS